MTKFFEKASSLLVYSLPILMVTGPFLSDLSIVLTGFFFLIILFKRKQFSFLKNKYSTIFFCFCIYILLRSIFTGEIISIKSSVFFPPHLYNLLGDKKAKRLITFSDDLLNRIPFVKNMGGILIIQGKKSLIHSET